MSRSQEIMALLTTVARALGPHRSEMVFVGGATVGLLITESDLGDMRPTDDVDVVAEVATYSKYTELLEKLRKLGFKHDMDGPLCRFVINGVRVDVMPTTEILGFRNRWYPEVVATSSKMKLNESIDIRLITAPLFICTKLEAFADRGKGDYVMSADMEDIVSVIDGRPELIAECAGSAEDVRDFLRTSFEVLANDQKFLEALPGMLAYGASNREAIIRDRIDQLRTLP
jgi:predicted nucleotidyltransferase